MVTHMRGNQVNGETMSINDSMWLRSPVPWYTMEMGFDRNGRTPKYMKQVRILTNQVC